MLINIPIQIDEKIFNETISKEYENKVTERLYKEILEVLKSYDDTYLWNSGKDARRGLDCIVRDRIDKILLEYKPDIIEAAGNELAKRLLRTKAAKELIEKSQMAQENKL